MKRRYYLRGLGIGIVFTSVFFLLTDSSSKTMSDEMIKARAKELGMIESTVLAEMSTSEAADEEETEGFNEGDFGKETPVSSEGNIKEEADTIDAAGEEITDSESGRTAEDEVEGAEISEDAGNKEADKAEAAEQKPGQKAENVQEAETVENSVDQEAEFSQEVPVINTTIANLDGNTISIYVVLGEGSDSVSRRLKEAGLIEDAHEYDKFLMQGGYDRRIDAGEHIIPVGATWEEIRDLICRQP